MNILKKLRYFFRNNNLNQEKIINQLDVNKAKMDELSNRIIELTNQVANIQGKLNIQETYYQTVANRLNMANIDYTNLELLSVLSDNSKTNLLICGFYAGDNVGDELMLQTLLDYFTPYDNLNIVIMLDYNLKYNILKNKKRNITYIHYPRNNYDLLTLASKFDKVVFGGGALIDDVTYTTDPLKMPLSKILIELTLCFLENEKEVFWLGLSSNHTIKNNDFIKKLDYIVNNINYISLRDQFSIDTLKKINIDTKKITLCEDIILSNKLLENQIKYKGNKKIGIILIWSEELYKDNEKFINNLLHYLKDNSLDYELDLIPFYDYQNNDYNFCKKVVESINSESLKVLNFSSDFNEVNKTISKCDIIISMRYHSSLISIIQNKKLLTILYSKHPHYRNKINYLYSHFSINGTLCSINDIKSKTSLNTLLYSFFNNNTAIDIKKNSEYLRNAKTMMTELISKIVQ